MYFVLCRYQLFCALTNRYVNRKPEEVRGHIQGRRYQKALLECKNCKGDFFPEDFLKVPVILRRNEVFMLLYQNLLTIPACVFMILIW